MTTRRRIKHCPHCGCGTRLSQATCLQCGFDFIAYTQRKRLVLGLMVMTIIAIGGFALKRPDLGAIARF